VFQLEKGMDTGPIYSQSSVDIDPSWRSSELLASLSQQGPIVLQEALVKISQGLSPIAQSGQSSLAPKISKEEARLDFSVHAKEPFKITSAVVTNNADIPMGAVITSEKSVYVGCADQSAIELLTVVPAGKREMKAIDWARGARLLGGEYFG
jgi:methionyl-tRNA formyltransferase